MTIKQIQARFTSGNDIPIDKAMVPADEWHMAMAEIQVLKDEIIWDKMAFEKLEKLCDERGSNEAKMFIRCRELADQVGQLQEQNTMLDKKLAEIERLRKEVDTLQRIVAESYQVMGILADEAGRFDDPHVIKAMDNAGLIELQHDDVLPFPCKPETTRMYTIASELQDTCDRQAKRLAEVERDTARYNWFRQGNRLTVKCKGATVMFGPNTERDYPEQLDAAIDAAMESK